ncbi:hypothetical protein OAJ75_01975 [Candidatus Pelagibacter sp.]|nr:hypothetical protein [Candidatus Pelagibacter sp.]
MLKKNILTYTNIRNFGDFHIPAPVQNLVLREYCINNNLHFSLPIEEYIFDNCYIELEGIISNLKKKNLLLLCSSEILPFETNYINYLINQLILNKCELHLILDKKVLKSKKEYFAFFRERLFNKKIIEISSNSLKEIKRYFHGNFNYRS